MAEKATNQDWLDQVQEEALEPELPIIDPHHHLWDQKVGRVNPKYFLEEMLEDTNSGHNIVATVFIECGAMFRADSPDYLKPLGETEFVNGIAAQSASGIYGPTRVAAGIVGTMDWRRGAGVAEILDQHITLGSGRFRGIRVGATWDASSDVENHRTEPPQGLYSDPVFRDAFKELAKRDLSFEAWCYHPQIPALADLARAHPDNRIVLDHFGGPIGIGPYADKKDEVFEEWKASLADLAMCENVVAKLGGLNMEVNGFDWHKNPKPPTSEELCEATRPYFEYTIEQFGPERCLFESNFPVDKLSCSYMVCWNSFKRLTANYSSSEKALMYHDVAKRVYKL
ncbi:MAG: amidohydrolase family protein [Pseudomonadota bacterium]|nr:amidohydrolase family protein [Pseudomonadota bacterium]